MTREEHVETARRLLVDVSGACKKALLLIRMERFKDAKDVLASESCYKLRICCDALANAMDEKK